MKMLKTIAICLVLSAGPVLLCEACHYLGGVAARSEMERTLLR